MDEKIYLGACANRKCAGPVHVIEKGDTLYSIAQKYHTRVRVLLDLNPFVDIYNLQPGEEICIPRDTISGGMEWTPYIIKEGDTIGTILKKYTITFEELVKINKGILEQKLPAGMILLLPGTAQNNQKSI